MPRRRFMGRHIHGATRRSRPTLSLRLPIPPQPSERVWQDGAALGAAVETVAEDELVVVAGEREGFGERLVRERPVAVVVVQVVGAVLEEHANIALRRLADHGLVVMTALLEVATIGDVREAADPAQHFVKLVRPLPGYGKRAD